MNMDTESLALGAASAYLLVVGVQAALPAMQQFADATETDLDNRVVAFLRAACGLLVPLLSAFAAPRKRVRPRGGE